MENTELNVTENQRKMTEKEFELSNIAFEVSVKLEKARTALRTTIDNFELDRINMTEKDGMLLAYNICAIHQMLEIVDDYIFKANNELEAAL